MKTLAIAIVATCIGHVLLQAAVIEKQFLIHFETDKFYLDEKAQVLLNNIAQQVCSGNYYEITAIGHTDNEGSQVYNETLSLKRVSEVKNYLITKGLEAALINSKWYGEKKPAAKNSDEQNKYLNRRVVLEVKQYEWKQAKEILSDLKSAEQEMVVSAKENCTIVSEAGIKINIPQNAFITESGKPVTQGHVTVKITDALSVADWLKNNLTTNSPSGMLQSGGMFKIEAYQNNEALLLQKGKELTVEVPYMQQQQGMSIFYANNSKDGKIIWENSNVPVQLKLENDKMPFLKIDTNQINLLARNYATQKIPIPEVDSIFLKVPKMPIFSSKLPKEPIKPSKEKIARKISLSAKLFYSKKKRNELIEKEYSKRYKFYDAQIKLYNKRINKYCEGYEKYVVDIRNYIENKYVYEEQIENGIRRLDEIVIAYIQRESLPVIQSELLLFSNYLSNTKVYDVSYYPKLIKKMSEKTNFSSNPQSLPEKIKVMVKHQKHLGIIKNEQMFISRVNRLKQSAVCILLSNDNDFQNVFITANNKLLKEKRELGMIETSDLNNYYSASLNTMGWINIDKFYKQELTASINIDYENNSQVYLIYKNLNAMMSYYGGNMNVPSNERIIVFSVTLINGKPYYAKNELITKRNNQHHIKLQYKEGLLADIENEIKTI